VVALEEPISKVDDPVVPAETGLEKSDQEPSISPDDQPVIDENSAKEDVTAMSAENSLIAPAALGNFTISITQVKGNTAQFTISTIGCAGKTGIGYVLFPTWSEKNGQDDIHWYQGTLGSN